MKPGDSILILPSCALSSLQLEALTGRIAIVTSVTGSFNNIKGCWVKLPEEYMGEEEWYIPYESIGL